MLSQIIILFFSSTVFAQNNLSSVSFIAFGDSGYHYDYLKPKVIKKPITPKKFVAARFKKWLAKYLPENEFQVQPMYIWPNTNHAIEASGAVPVAKAMHSYCGYNKCEFAIMLGDNIYPRGATGEEDELRFKKLFEEPYQQLIKSHENFKMYAALGNHDWKTSREGRNIQIEYGERPDTALTMKSPGYYSYVKGDVEFFVIDTNLLLAGTVVMDAELHPDGSEKPVDKIDSPKDWELPNDEDVLQVKWLENSLKNSTAKWKVVYGHHTLWSSGGSKFEEARALRKLITPLICRYADVYVAGHEHLLELNLDTCQAELGTAHYPLPLVISGAGSWQRPIHTPFQTKQQIKYPQFKALWSKGMTWGFTHFEFIGNKMLVTMLTTSNDSKGKPVFERIFSFNRRNHKTKDLP